MTWRTRLREGCPFTLAGAVLLALCAGTFWFQGVKRLDLVLLAGSVLAVALVLALGTATILAALVLRRRPVRGAGALLLEGGAWNATGLRVRLTPWLPFLTLRLAWEAPLAVRVDLLPGGEERAWPRRRALAPCVVRRIRVGDILGLTELGWLATDPAPARILPPPSALDPGAVLTGLVPGEDEADPRGAPQGDRVDVRKYGQGDPMRMILWKVYARTRKAFVRMPERAIEPAPRVCAYLPANPWDEPPARLARTFLERGLLGPGWRFGADGAEDAHTLDQALTALAVSGTGAAPGLPSFLDRAQRDGFGACLVLLPAKDGPWVADLQAALAGAPLRVQVVLVLEGWTPEPPPRWRRVFLRPTPPTGSTPGEVEALLGRLLPPGQPCTLVDTLSGAVLTSPERFLAKQRPA